MYFALPLMLAAAPLALAQYNYGSGSASTTTSSSSSAETSSSGPLHVVKVSNSAGDLTFTPNDFTAAVGDTVEFHFYGPKHSVAQSTFASPCAPANANAFFSGPITTSGTGVNSEIFTLNITSTAAIWIYCAVPSHCESGMAAVINAPADGSKTLAMYQAAAAKVSGTTAPSTVQGLIQGTLSSSTTSSTSSSAASPSATKNAGVEARGGVKWAALGFTGAAAALFGSLIV
ncbi:hypothetical protein N431DRAFT_391391 [Stipitochalara longipes BDJ]|nr:hypothetical protein N431DRAFT_391391 [Stipitochalara longipes BDJ]